MNKNIYTLSSKSTFYKVVSPNDKEKIELKVFNATTILKCSVTFTLVPNEPVEIFYMLALKGTDEPSYAEVVAGGPNPIDTT